MATDMHPGDAEAAAAINGMRETYGRPLPEVGQWVTGEAFGKRFSGTVRVADPCHVIVEVDPENQSCVIVPPSLIDDWN